MLAQAVVPEVYDEPKKVLARYASSTKSTVAECAEERSSKGRLRSNGEAARKGPRPRIKIKPQNCQIQVIGAGVVATSIRSKNLRMRSICVPNWALRVLEQTPKSHFLQIRHLMPIL